MPPTPRTARRLLAVAAAGLAVALPASAVAAGESERVLVQLAPGTNAAERAEVADALDATGTEGLGGGWRAYDLEDPADAAEARAELRAADADDAVVRVEPDALLVPAAEPLQSSLWGLENTGQSIGGVSGTPGADISAPAAWAATTDTAEVTVAVIDTGVDLSHPDLARRLWTNPREVVNGVDDDGNGLVDDVSGWDFHDDDASVFDSPSVDGHGTHVAGTIAAAHDGAGIGGVAPNARIMPLKFLGPYGGYTSDAIRAIEYARANGAKVINASWGGGSRSTALQAAIDRAIADGIVFVAAAGNNAQDIDASPYYPAAYPNPAQITVAASTNRDERASFSNHGATAVDVAAPGQGILSSVPGGGYQSWNGTSMAAPHVAGAAAVLIGARPGLTPAQVRQALLDGSDRVAALDGVSVSSGRIDLARSLEAVGVATPPAATPAPVPAPAPAPAPAPPAETAPPAQTAPPAELTPPVTRTPRARTRASRPRIRTIARRGGRRPVVRIRVATTVGVRHRVRVGRTTTRWTTGAVLSTRPLRAGRTHVIRVQSRDRTGRIATSTPLRITVSRTGATRLVSGGTRLPVRRGARRVRE